MLLNLATSVLGYGWIGYLLTDAIHEARGVSRRHAAAIAGVLLSAWSLV